jgi:hypothetical protein
METITPPRGVAEGSGDADDYAQLGIYAAERFANGEPVIVPPEIRQRLGRIPLSPFEFGM